MFRPLKRLKKRTLFYSLLAIILIIAYTVPKLFEPERPESNPIGDLEATFIDVGQGNAFLMKTSNDKIILIDGGEFDNYETHLKPYLDSRGIEKIDIAIVSHYHSDHMGGISRLTKDGKVRKLILPDYPDTDNSRSLLEKHANKAGTDITYVSRGDRIDCECHGLLVDVLHPLKGGTNSEDYHNRNSLVLRIVYGKTVLMLTGDIDSSVERKICDLRENIECDILQIAHHGSSTSTAGYFISETAPTYAVIQVGAGNNYGHPHHEPLSTLEDSDVTVYRNDRDGHISFTISPTAITDVSFSK